MCPHLRAEGHAPSAVGRGFALVRPRLPPCAGTIANYMLHVRIELYATSSKISASRSGMSTITSWPHGTS